MKVLNDILGYKDLKIYQDTEFFRFSLDSIILANYCNIRLKDKNICDFGTGNGVIPIILSRRTNANIYCVEIQSKLYNLAIESFELNNLSERIKIFNCDIDNKDLFSYNEFFDLIVCNPPYFKVSENSLKNISIEKQIARHEVMMDLDKLFFNSFRCLKNGGNICLVHRPDRIMEILDTMRKYNIEPKRVKFIYNNIKSDSKLVLVEGQKCGGKGLLVESPLIMYNMDGSMTDEYKKITEEVRI